MVIQDMAGKKIRSPKRKQPLICTVMRVKNEEKYLRYGLESLRALGGPVVVLDDGSTDATMSICSEFDYVHYFRQDDQLDIYGEPYKMDEGRDRTFIMREALKLKPQWVFTLDGDEVLDPTTPERMLAAVTNCPDDVNVFEMFMAVMQTGPGEAKQKWLGPPEPYGRWQMDRMFRVRDADTAHEFVSNFTNNLHCGCVPPLRDYKRIKLDAWIRYYGYESPQAIERKAMFYEEHDPVNFPNVARMWRERAKYRPQAWPANPIAGAMSIANTVRY